MKKNRNSTNFSTIPTQYSTAKTPTKMCEVLILLCISIGEGIARVCSKR